MDINPKIEQYVFARQALDDVMAEKKRLQTEVDELGAELVGYIDMHPELDRLAAETGHKLGKAVTRSADIVDYRALEEWALVEGDAYVAENWWLFQASYKMHDIKQEVFTLQPNRRLLTILTKHFSKLAEARGVDINDLLPPGLKQKATEYIKLYQPSSKKQEAANLVGESLMEMAKRGAMEGE